MSSSKRRIETYIRLFSATLISVFLLSGLLFWFFIGPDGGSERFPLGWFIAIAAILGSVVNQPFRAENIVVDSVAQGLSYIFWKCTVSIVFAFTLHMLFIGGFVSGDLFPKFINTTIQDGGQYAGMKEFATQVDPESYKDVAKILVWSFIAGFSEKFVPNLIEQTAKKATEKDTPS